MKRECNTAEGKYDTAKKGFSTNLLSEACQKTGLHTLLSLGGAKGEDPTSEGKHFTAKGKYHTGNGERPTKGWEYHTAKRELL